MSREKAYTQGSLRTSGNQNVVVQDRVIVVEPANPEVITVPVYDPYVVYGPWWYPAYPPYAFYSPGFIVGSNVLFFGAGVFFGAAWGYAWGLSDWYHHHCFVDVHRHVRFNPHIDRRRYADRFAAAPMAAAAGGMTRPTEKGSFTGICRLARGSDKGKRPGTGARQEFRGRAPDGGAGAPRGVDRPAVVGPRSASGRDGAAPGGVRDLPGRSVPGGSRADHPRRRVTVCPAAQTCSPA